MNTKLTPLQIAQEAYCNIFKDRFGIRPRFMTNEQWNDIDWLNRQMQYELDEQEWHGTGAGKELSYFEELLNNFTEADYE